MEPLRIALLGTPRVDVDGQQLAVDTRKAVAMLAFLAVGGHAQSRAVVAALLWPEAGPDRARAALRRTLSTLRTALGDERLHADRDSIRLELADAWFDVAETRRIAADPTAGAAALEAACDLHRDDFLAGFSIRDSAAFDDWQRAVEDGLRRERAQLLDRCIESLVDDGRLDDAAARAAERLELDRLHEPTHRRLIQLFAATGRRGDALSQYRECVRVLSRELGVRPLAETTELYHAISAGTAPEPPRTASVPATGELPFVGRTVELDRILAAHAAVAVDGRAVVVEGGSGAGKTRLVEEAAAALERASVTVISVRAVPDESGLAYGVVAQLLRAAAGGADREALPESLRNEAARLVPSLGSAPSSSLDEPGARLRFLESVGDLLAAGFSGNPGVVLVDDLHWADPASLDALRYLARRLAGRRLLLLATRRTDEPDPAGRATAVAALAERIPLGPLSRDDVLELAARSGLDEAAGDDVFRESEGLPLLVFELLAGGASAGGVRALLDARLDAVGEAAWQVLSAAALIGRAFDEELLRSVSGRSEAEVADAVAELTARALIVRRDDALEFAHERLRTVVEDRLGLARRRLLHRRISDALAARHEDAALVARHLERAGHDDRAAAAYADAGDRARALSAGAEAAAHYEAAIALGHADPAALYEAIGDVQTLRGEYRRALAGYDAAAAQDGADTGRLEHKLGAVHERRAEWQLADSHYTEALRLGADAAVVQSDLSRVAWRQGDIEEAQRLGFAALRLAEAAGAVTSAAQANNILGLLGCGRAHLERSLELSAELADPSIRIAALNNLGLAYAADGELAQAQALIRQALDLCTAQGDRHHQAALRNNLADVLHKAGQSDGAMEQLKRAATAFAAIGAEDDNLYPGVWSLVDW